MTTYDAQMHRLVGLVLVLDVLALVALVAWRFREPLTRMLATVQAPRARYRGRHARTRRIVFALPVRVVTA